MSCSYVSHKKEYLEAISDQLFDNMFKVQKNYKADIKAMLSSPPARTGKVYYNVKGKAVHTAAAPNPDLGGSGWEPPAELSGALIRSIDDAVRSKEGTTYEGAVYSTSEYVLALEFGDLDNNLVPRPAWNLTLYENKDEYAEIALKGFNRG